MRLIRAENVHPGMTLAKTIYLSNGFPLLAEGTSLSEAYVARLVNLGFTSVYVDNHFKLDDKIELSEPISVKTRVEAVKALKNIFIEFSKTKRLLLNQVSSQIKTIVDEVMYNRQKVIDFVDIRSSEDYLFGHSINVCILAVQIGISLEYNELQLRDIAMGAILHDVGQMLVKNDILEKKGTLTPVEFAEIKRHSKFGFDTIREQKELSLLSAHIAFQHHERYNGSGYPRGLKGQDIHEYSRIVAVCDVYDALIKDRPYRKAYLPHEAIKIIKDEAGKLFDPIIVNLFEGMIAKYPTGTLVQLNSGEIGIVCKNVKDSNDCKIHVILLLDKDSKPILGGKVVALDNCTEIQVDRVLEDNDPFIKICS